MESGGGFLSADELRIDPKWLIDPKQLFVGPRIGEGAHAKVYEGKYKNQNVAIKVVHRGDTPEEVEKREERFLREVAMLSRVQHKNLVKFIGACKEPVMVVVTELLLGGSLRKYMLNLRPQSLDPRVAVGFALDISRAMECLHSHGIIHRDLKPENMLLTADHRTVKLVDLGLAREETLTEMSRVSGNSVWMVDGGGGDDDDGATWSRSHLTAAGDKDELGLASFKSMLEDDWYMGGGGGGGGSSSTAAFDASSVAFPTDQHLPPPAAAAATLLPPHVDSSSSCSPTSGFNLDPSQPFFASKTGLSSLLSSVCSTPFEPYEAQQPLFGMTNSLFGLSGQMGCPDLSPAAQYPISGLPPPQGGATTSTGFENSAFINRSKVIRPLEIFPPVGAQPTLFQKRAARQNSSPGSLGLLGFGLGSGAKRRGSEEDEFDEASFDGSGLNYDSDEAAETGKGEGSDKNGGGEGNNSNGNSTVTGGGDQKGKKKGLPAKNLMAERRRRKKLNDRLYMLRSVVPKISKMDRASILGDAIEYLKELLQRINDLHNELESTPSSSMTPPNSSNFHPLTPTPPTLPCRVKEELCQSLLPSPSSQTPKVEVRLREGRAVNVHMFCNRKPGLLISTMRALDNLGLDIQQAVISCFNGFALDVFRAEQSKDGPNALPEEIKAVLLQAAGFHSM